MTRIIAFVLFIISMFSNATLSQPRTVGLLQYDSAASKGYTLFAPIASTTTYLIDMDGRLVHSWEATTTPGFVARLLPNGDLFRLGVAGGTIFSSSGGAGGIAELYDWDGNLKWHYHYASDTSYCQHHDAEVLPNGNIVVVAWERITRAEMLAAGRNLNGYFYPGVWPDHLIELKPIGSDSAAIVWEWHAWDHLVQDFDSTKENYGVVEKHPELIDVNFTGLYQERDWMHSNAVTYNPKLDQLMITIFYFGEIWVIDHSTTTSQASGHIGGRYSRGGDLLYRWGNPLVYRHGQMSDQFLFGPHAAHWIADGLPGAGNILVFNNGYGRSANPHSSIEEIVPPVDVNGNYTRDSGAAFGPKTAAWDYTAPVRTDFYSPFISNAQRLPNGNTLICSGSNGTFFEVTKEGKTVWKYINPVNAQGPMMQGERLPNGDISVFRAYRYAPDYPGLVGRDLTPGDFIELYPTAVPRMSNAGAFLSLSQNYPNPAGDRTTIDVSAPRESTATLRVFDLLGREVATHRIELHGEGVHSIDVPTSSFAPGVYRYRLEMNGRAAERLMIVTR